MKAKSNAPVSLLAGPKRGRSEAEGWAFASCRLSVNNAVSVPPETAMTAKTRFRGSFTALVTPFKNGSVDEAAFRALVDWQIAEGTHGLVPGGTTGESPTPSQCEHKRVVEWCIEPAKKR